MIGIGRDTLFHVDESILLDGEIVMKVIVIGLGSMGRRRIRLLQQYDSNIEIVGIDTVDERRQQAKKEFGIKVADSISDACKDKFDCAFVSTSPLSHASIINECLKHDLNVFTELNLVDDMYDENIALAKERGKILFLSSTFIYRKEVEYIKSKVERSRCPLTYTYHAGQYLPDWHPWESYKKFFVGDKRTSGIREFMAIEFPWLTDIFGSIVNFHVIKNQVSSLTLEYPDRYILTLEHSGGTKGAMVIDLVSRKASRNFELFSEDLYLTWDGTPTGLCDYDFEKKENHNINLYEAIDKRADYNSTIIEDAYLNEIVDFFNSVGERGKPRYSFEKDRQIISVINKII